MIVTEEMLSPHRSARAPISLSMLRRDWFSSTLKAFEDDWSNHRVPGSNNISRDKLEIVLVLAFTIEVPVLHPGREWLALNHQCGSHSCASEKMIATRLTPRHSVLPSMRAIAREGYYAEAGHFDRGQLLASRIANYVVALKRDGLDCEATWRYLTESLYPIDATQENLNCVAQDAIDLHAMVEGLLQARYIRNPVIFFMTENSD